MVMMIMLPTVEFRTFCLQDHCVENVQIRIHKTNFVCYSLTLLNCSLTIREYHRLRVSENMVLRRISGSRGIDVTGGSRKLHNEELNICSFSKV
jgi:hypothetical protein